MSSFGKRSWVIAGWTLTAISGIALAGCSAATAGAVNSHASRSPGGTQAAARHHPAATATTLPPTLAPAGRGTATPTPVPSPTGKPAAQPSLVR